MRADCYSELRLPAIKVGILDSNTRQNKIACHLQYVFTDRQLPSKIVKHWQSIVVVCDVIHYSLMNTALIVLCHQ